MKGLLNPAKYTLLTLSVAAALSHPIDVWAVTPDELEFDPSFLNLSDSSQADLSRFSRGGSALPGIYPVRIFLNNELIQLQKVTFKSGNDGVVHPCLNSGLISQLPLNTTNIPERLTTGGEDNCVDLNAFIPEARVFFDSSEQSLNIQVPQIWVNKMARGSVPPSAWDGGVPAILLGYSTSAYQSESYGRTYKSVYSSLNSGLNIGNWFLRHNGNWKWNDSTGGHYQRINTYVQRDVPSIKGRFQVGQTYTSGQIFDSLSFSGAKLESDERMEPNSRRGYAPEVRGIARTSAQVSVHQDGILLYETTVSPGEFVIDDLYPTGYGGDLDITIREADGSEQHFQVPYAPVTSQLRPGMSRYELAAGELRNDYLNNSPSLWQGSWQYGLSNRVTMYGGGQGSEHYFAGQAGTAVSSLAGSVGVDITHARSELSDKDTRTGESYRVSYSKNFRETRSNFSLAAYRFSTSGYMDLMTAMESRNTLNKGGSSDSIRRTKSRFTLSASQGLPERWGQLFISASMQNYWNDDSTDKQYQIGYNNRWKSLSWGINANRSYTSMGESQDSIMLSFNLPLGSGPRMPHGRLSYSGTEGGRESWQAGISGAAGENYELGYGISGTTTNKGGGSSGSANLSYRSPWTALSGSYSTGRNYNSLSAGMSGTLIGHGGGLTVTPYQGDTFALVEAKGAEGAKVGGYSGVYVDWNGYAAVPYLSAYQMNSVSVDLQGTELGVELDSTMQKVAPRDKAVVKLSYNARSGRPLLINVRYQGETLPFGSELRDEKGTVVGYAGQGGQVFARVQRDHGQIQAKWGNGANQSCKIDYQLPYINKKVRAMTLYEFKASCR
ncbi:TPA: fimbria/pilus outer membrane usher protein [Klebsiella michiganensis]